MVRKGRIETGPREDRSLGLRAVVGLEERCWAACYPSSSMEVLVFPSSASQENCPTNRGWFVPNGTRLLVIEIRGTVRGA